MSACPPFQAGPRGGRGRALRSSEEIAAVVCSVDRPVNVVMGLQGVQLSLAELAEIGVKRVSVGSALSRAALGAFLRAAREMQERGTFTYAAEAVSFRDISAMFAACGSPQSSISFEEGQGDHAYPETGLHVG